MTERNRSGEDLAPVDDSDLPVRQTIWIRPQSDFRAMTVFLGAIIDGYQRLLESGEAVELMVETDQIIIKKVRCVVALEAYRRQRFPGDHFQNPVPQSQGV